MEGSLSPSMHWGSKDVTCVCDVQYLVSYGVFQNTKPKLKTGVWKMIGLVYISD